MCLPEERDVHSLVLVLLLLPPPVVVYKVLPCSVLVASMPIRKETTKYRTPSLSSSLGKSYILYGKHYSLACQQDVSVSYQGTSLSILLIGLD